jgi:DNA-binding IclR family transcriptional regulator
MINKSTKQTFDILRIICSAREALGVAEIARRAEVPASTAHRSMIALEATGYISKLDNSSKFIPGKMTAQLARAFCERYTIRAASMPYLRQMTTATDKTTTLNVRIGWYAVCIAIIEPAQESFDARWLTERHLLHDGCASQVIAANLGGNELREYFDFIRQQSITVPSGWSEAAFIKQLKLIKNSGYATEDAGVGTLQRIAFPIFGGNGEAIASVTIEGIEAKAIAPRSRKLRQCAAIVKEFCATVQENADHFSNPFGHIDSNTIVFSD